MTCSSALTADNIYTLYKIGVGGEVGGIDELEDHVEDDGSEGGELMSGRTRWPRNHDLDSVGKEEHPQVKTRRNRTVRVVLHK